MTLINKRAKKIIIRALRRFVVAQDYIAGKVETEQKVEIHKDIEIAVNLIRQLSSLGD